ncbi:MAG: hypothetical protein QXP42_01005 [Candidatus Micrarchaeia archaeon]
MEKYEIYDRDISTYHRKIMENAIRALKDDIGDGDITSDAVVQDCDITGEIKARKPAVVCGLLEGRTIFEANGLVVRVFVDEGEYVGEGTTIMRVTGNAKKMFSCIRLVVDYLHLLSGIATTTRELEEKYPGRIAATRKSHPGLLLSEKRAVSIGGGFTHRVSLSDGYLIKDHHIDAVGAELFGQGKFVEERRVAATQEAIRRAEEHRKKKGLSCPIIVEVISLEQAVAAAKIFTERGVPDAILIDNKTPEEVKKIVQEVRPISKDIKIEASGGITPYNIEEYLNAGVDVVSMSYLILGATDIDFYFSIVGE